MWTSGITQGLMLNATTEHGTILTYPNFLDTVNVIQPMMLMRVIGGALYLTGWFMMAYNLWRSVRGAEPVNGTNEVFDGALPRAAQGSVAGWVLNTPVLFCVLGLGFASAWMFGGH